MIAGTGFRRGVSVDEILDAVQRACAAAGVDPGGLDALATADFKAGESGVRGAAERLGLPLIACTRDDLARMGHRVHTRSASVTAAVGVPAVAEAAALAAAGRGAKLLGPRVASKVATCAIAIGDGP